MKINLFYALVELTECGTHARCITRVLRAGNGCRIAAAPGPQVPREGCELNAREVLCRPKDRLEGGEELPHCVTVNNTQFSFSMAFTITTLSRKGEGLRYPVVPKLHLNHRIGRGKSTKLFLNICRHRGYGVFRDSKARYVGVHDRKVGGLQRVYQPAAMAKL